MGSLVGSEARLFYGTDSAEHFFQGMAVEREIPEDLVVNLTGIYHGGFHKWYTPKWMVYTGNL